IGLFEKAKDSSDPYYVALAGISHINQNKPKEGVELLTILGKLQKEDGHVGGAQTSITGSGGRDLVIETTALATLGWLKANRPEEFNPTSKRPSNGSASSATATAASARRKRRSSPSKR